MRYELRSIINIKDNTKYKKMLFKNNKRHHIRSMCKRNAGFALVVCLLMYSITAYSIAAALDEDSTTSSQTASNSSTEGRAHVYVFNRDDDRLRISLFIDDTLMASKEISSEEETKFGEYSLNEGEHSFRISWWDEDTQKKYLESVVVYVNDDTPVHIYTSKNAAPEKFYLSILVKNENDRDLDVCLYIDERFERCSVAKKSSLTEVGKIKLESGRHNLSVRWIDPETEIEYQKSRSVELSRDDAVMIYTPKGVIFKKDADKSKKSSQNANSSQEKADERITESKNDVSVSTKKNISTNASAEDYQGRIEFDAIKVKEPSEQTVKNSANKQDNPTYKYIYAALIVFAVYLLFRS